MWTQNGIQITNMDIVQKKMATKNDLKKTVAFVVWFPLGGIPLVHSFLYWKCHIEFKCSHKKANISHFRDLHTYTTC